jgi:ABC-type uncharacterized transport system substrate-binding protein
MKFIVSVLSIFLLLSLPGKALSHPHVFIYNSIKVVFNKKGLVGFKVKWVFDEMFSNMIIYDYDKNGNKRFESSEIREIKNGAFSNLKNFDYFTHIKIDKSPFKVKFVKNFSAAIKGDVIIYSFFVPCHVSAISSFKEIKISIYDISFYCSVFLAKKPIEFENASLYEFHYRIGKNKKEAYYYGQVYPEDIIIKFRLKDG